MYLDTADHHGGKKKTRQKTKFRGWVCDFFFFFPWMLPITTIPPSATRSGMRSEKTETQGLRNVTEGEKKERCGNDLASTPIKRRKRGYEGDGGRGKECQRRKRILVQAGTLMLRFSERLSVGS